MRKTQTTAFVLLCIVIYSCNSPRYIYSPSPPNNPYFTKKGDSKIAAYYSGGSSRSTYGDGKNRGFDLQGAYSIDDHWAILADYFNRNEKDIYDSYRTNFFDSSIVDYKRHITSIGGGYYTAIDKNQTAFFNIFGGIGMGKFSVTDNGLDKNGVQYSRFHNSSITKWYIQPSFNFMPSPNFNASFVGKFSFVSYGKISTSYQLEEQQYFYFDQLFKKTLFFFEPTFNMQIGASKCDWMKIDLGTTFSTNPYFQSTHSRARVRGFNFSAGLCFDFSKIKKK